MAETIVLDPTEVAIGRSQFDITAWVDAEAGIDWGDAAIQTYMAQLTRGETPVDYRVPNRQIQIPLNIRTIGATTFDAMRAQLQAKAALFQRDGGWIKRTTAIGPVFAEVVTATLKLSGSWLQAHKSVDVDAVLTLEALPDWYGAEEDLGDNSTTTLPELIFNETGIDGHYPSRVRIVVDEDDAETQLGLIWGFRGKHFSAASTAQLAYGAEALTRLDTAANAALAGASGGTVVRHGTLATNWTPVVGTNIGGTSFMTHTGTYRVRARVYSTSGTAVQARFVWDVGDLTFPVENTEWTFPSGSQFFQADLGEIRIDQVPSGSVHRWQGQIQAKGAVGNEEIQIDRLTFQPLDDGAGLLKANISGARGLSTFSARDEFNQIAGALTGKTAQIGGVWVGAGDADDFTINTTDDTAQRTAVADLGVGTGGRQVTLNLNLTNTFVSVDSKATVLSTHRGVIFRYVDASNWASATLVTTGKVRIAKVIAGGETTIKEVPFTHVAGQYYTIAALADSQGYVSVWAYPQGAAAGSPLLTISDPVFATGGALATGDAGIRDHQIQGDASTRDYDNFAAWVPTLDAVMFPSQSLEMRTDGFFREDTSGTAFGPVSDPISDYPRLPVPAMAGGTVQVFIKASRGDFDQLPDSGIDDVSARVFSRPCWLYVPDS